MVEWVSGLIQGIATVVSAMVTVLLVLFYAMLRLDEPPSFLRSFSSVTLLLTSDSVTLYQCGDSSEHLLRAVEECKRLIAEVLYV